VKAKVVHCRITVRKTYKKATLVELLTFFKNKRKSVIDRVTKIWQVERMFNLLCLDDFIGILSNSKDSRVIAIHIAIIGGWKEKISWLKRKESIMCAPENIVITMGCSVSSRMK
jgi:hypothetical protein